MIYNSKNIFFITVNIFLSMFLISCSGKTTATIPDGDNSTNISEVEYNKGISILKELNANQDEENFSTYWNLAVAYTYLQRDPDSIKQFILKGYSLNSKGFQAALNLKPKMIKRWESTLSKREMNMLTSENNFMDNYSNDKIEPNYNSGKEKVIDESLKFLIAKIGNDDQLYRIGSKKDAEKQKVIDIENLRLIDSLFEKYNTYIGRSLVGKEFESVMWAIIQHSNVESMEKYLPIIHKAVMEEELNESPLRLLIDRIYSIKFNYQIFGSQYGVPITKSKEEILNINKQFNLSSPHIDKSTFDDQKKAKNEISNKNGVIKWNGEDLEKKN